jgi:hypothetical protein
MSGKTGIRGFGSDPLKADNAPDSLIEWTLGML